MAGIPRKGGQGRPADEIVKAALFFRDAAQVRQDG